MYSPTAWQKYIGAYAAAMNGVDCIAFTAGIGENDDYVREQVCSYLGYLGVDFDKEVNGRTERNGERAHKNLDQR